MKPEGWRFEQTGYVESGEVVGNIYPNMKSGLHGRKLRVTTLPVSKISEVHITF